MCYQMQKFSVITFTSAHSNTQETVHWQITYWVYAANFTNTLNFGYTFSCVHEIRRYVSTVEFHSLNQFQLIFQCLAIL